MPMYQGSGGAIFEITLPERGHRRELIEERIANGDLVLVEEPKGRARGAKADDVEVEP